MRRPANHVRVKYEALPGVPRAHPRAEAEARPDRLDEWAYTCGGRTPTRWCPRTRGRSTRCSATPTSTSSPGFTFATSTYSAAHGQAVLNPDGPALQALPRPLRHDPRRGDGQLAAAEADVPGRRRAAGVNAGSDTFPLDVAAAWTRGPQGAHHRRASIRPRPQQTLSLEIRGAALSGKGDAGAWPRRALTATIVVGQKPGVEVEEQALAALPGTPTFAPFSVSIYEFPAK